MPAMRVLLGAFAVLTALAVGSLFVLATSTEETFAWTIAPPLTAAFIGAGYGAGFLLVVLSLRAGTWACVRVPVMTIFVFVVLTLTATLIHLDRLHFAGEFAGLGPLAKGAAWVWFAVYLVVPVALLVLGVAQERAPGADPPARHPVPAALRGALGVESAVLVVVGVLLYAVPTSADTVWPWQLTPFTGRIIAAWLLAFGVATALASVAGDLERLRTAAIAYTAFGALVAIAVLRFPGTVEWGHPAAWLFVAVTVAVIATGGIGWRLSPTPAGPSRG
jgi:hypothetical protein